jgi:hypothetical protein
MDKEDIVMGLKIDGVYVTKLEGAERLSYIIPEDMEGRHFNAFLIVNDLKLNNIINENE